MFRKEISNGDLIQLEPSWFGFGKYRLHRNLSEEVRLLGELEEKAKSKYLELSMKHMIAAKNVGEDLETLQILLLENSDAYFETGVDNSILEKREGVRYNFNRGGNNKQTNASSNKDKQGNQQKNGGKGQQQSNSKRPQGIPLAKLLTGSIVLH